jgi:hypothetical protein
MARRLGLVLAIATAFLVLGVPFYGTSSSGSGYVRPVSPVEDGTLSEAHGPSPPDMGELWAAAEDSSPDLATNGKTGTSGAGSRSPSTTAPIRAPRPGSSPPYENTT